MSLIAFKRMLAGAVTVLGIVVLFQNCAPKGFNTSLTGDGSNSIQTCDPSIANCFSTPDGPVLTSCTFNGQVIDEGGSVTAYLNSTTVGQGQCQSETRTCTGGQLSGSFQFASCNPGQPRACLFNGVTVASGQSVRAFLASSSANCQFEDRVCQDGTLSGSYAYSSCTNGGPASCLFNGQTVASGSAVVAYQASSVQTGQVCAPEARVCNNGQLSGSYQFSSCTVGTDASCQFNGMTFPSGSQVVAYASSMVPFGGTCVPVTRQCNNGVLSGTAAFASCSVNGPMSCLFNGRTVAHLESVMAYGQANVPYGQACQSKSRVCNNGTLTGSLQSSSCTVGNPRTCQFNGMNIAHGANTTAYISATVPYGQQCIPQTRTCSDGTLSGAGAYSACVVGPAVNCSFGGATVADNSSVTAYASASVPFGSACASETRTCRNGVLSGAYGYGSCSVGAPANCSFNGQVIAHGGGIMAYASSVVPYGSSCAAEARYCSNGNLSGSYGNGSCQVQAPSELWTWLPDFFQTTCPYLCDGMQQVRCEGSGCPGRTFWHYGASGYQQPPYTPGSQTTTRPGYIGTIFSSQID